MTARELAAQFKLHRSGHEWRGRCPCCGYAEAFVLSDGKYGPIGWCASCQDQGAVAAALGDPHRAPTSRSHEKDERTTREHLERAQRLWDSGEPVPGTAAGTYLETRCIGDLARCLELRFHASCSHPSSTLERSVRLPALTAAARDVDGKFIGIHRTYLRRDGTTKADIDPQKASLGPIKGGAVRLASLDQVLAAGELVIGEGIETSASAGLLLGLPAWAAVSCGNLERSLVLPPEVRSVAIAADPDEPGRRAANAAWHRWRKEGRRVRIITPNRAEDFNDIARRRLAQGGAP